MSSTQTSILGISAFFHDSAAALVVDGAIVAAAQEERFTRVKNDHCLPKQAIGYCLLEGRVNAADLDYVVFYEKPLQKFERLLETYLAFAPQGLRSFRKAIPLWGKTKLHVPREIRKALGGQRPKRLVFAGHHESHAASAFFPSPFEEAAILTIDGVGEWSTATLGEGRGNRIALTEQMKFPHSLGMLYSAFTYYCGFKVNHGEYKLMGLAPYGRPTYVDLIHKHLATVRPDGSLWLNMDYFNYCQGLTMTGRKFHDLFGGPPRTADSQLEQRHMDLAASVQAVTEDVMSRMARELHRRTGLKKLVLAGGVALNCVANGKLLRDGPFEDIWIQPAAGDAGGALGAALFVWHQLLDQPRQPAGGDSMQASLLGPKYAPAQVKSFLDGVGARYRSFPAETELLDHVAQQLTQEKIVGWFHGRMEFGPRALGARSILGDARSPRMQAKMNTQIKFRESFRPFAPCCLRAHVHEWFDMRPSEDSPYMLQVAPVLKRHRRQLETAEIEALRSDPDLLRRVNIARSSVPAITHVDYSARVQTVDERHGRFYRLMEQFHQKTGCPIIINTSFNMSWEPIVRSPEDAYKAFMQSEMDLLVLEDFVLHKSEQPLGLEVRSSDAAQVPSAASPWIDPKTGDPLVVTSRQARNLQTGALYPVEDGIPRLFLPTSPADDDQGNVLETVQQFYEQTPFPNYDDADNVRALLEKSRADRFAQLLNEQIPCDARVVEIGCGTGQLTNFLAIGHRTALGTDICLNSLRLAQKFKEEQGLERASFAQMNLFRPALREGFFDYVISNGVLHHTHDTRLAFARIGQLVRPGGYLVVGLYSAYSRRLIHYTRRALHRWMGLSGRWLDPHFDKVRAEGKRAAWYQDQYCHPHERCHSLGEVLGWLDEDGFEFVNSIPKAAGGLPLGPRENLFEPKDRGSALSRFLSQSAHIKSGYSEGGFFVVIARRDRGTKSTHGTSL